MNLFKQAALSASKPPENETTSPQVSTDTSEVGKSACHRELQSETSDDESQDEYAKVAPVSNQRLFSSKKYESKYSWLYFSSAKGGYCCKICELFSSTDKGNIFILGTFLGDHPTPKLEGHVNGSCHKTSVSKYVLVNSSGYTPNKVKKTVADMLVENLDVKRKNEIERNRNYVQCLIKILYFIVQKRWALDSFEPMLDFIASLKPPSISEYMDAADFILLVLHRRKVMNFLYIISLYKCSYILL